uniref:NADH-ubiquinone oxidoreductase chain 3 n=1 Tax=Anacestra spiniger TaxID=2813426 RepID=A0A8T9ZXK4_9HEMI|nr:NADH dehydrogenase subunit 3 [Anacestra spiniger]
MLKVMMSVSLTFLISLILMILCTIISKKSIKDQEKMSPFECGFDPKSNARMPFSLQFFLIAIIFLIFDVEIVLILPLMVSLKMMNIMSWMIITVMFIMILILGLYFEWKNGMLEWTF